MADNSPSLIARFIGMVMKVTPLLFAFGFLVPAIRAVIIRAGWSPPLSISPLAFALLIGGGWGLVAQIRGRWI